jgi:hypothetical protein
LGCWELGWWARRRAMRKRMYTLASQAAESLQRPLVVVGAPDGGVTSGYGCGDVTIDIGGSVCPTSMTADITQSLPFKTDSVVVFVSCVLEYVEDVDAAIAELMRISGGFLYVVRVEPWTATAYLYPGAKRTLPESLCKIP